MGEAASLFAMTPGEFLAWEAKQAERHEYVAGDVFSMAGAEDRHVTVAGNCYIALRRHLAGTPCRTYMSDMKLGVAAADSYFYPDVLVTCSAADHASALIKYEAKLLIEVLSPRTAAYDRGDKFADYRLVPTLAEFVLIDIDSRRTDVYRRGGDGLWVLHPFDAGDTVELTSVQLQITADELFAEVEPPAAVS